MSQPDASFDPKEFRRALGRFATGVTIVTTRDAQGQAVGMTANSFNSVSLQPPMVLWSLAKSARSLPAFTQATHWNVHILANDQEALSNRFARAGEDKFAGLALDPGSEEAPLLPGCSARFRCRVAFQYEGGDHVIFVGEVLGYEASERPPLLYVTGNYALAARKAEPVSTEPQANLTRAPYSENLLGYLLGRAHFQFMGGLREQLARHGLSDADFFLLCTLGVQSPLSLDALAAHVRVTGTDVQHEALHSLVQRGLLHEQPTGFALSPQGQDLLLHLLAAAKAVEAHVTAQLGELETALLRNALKQCIKATDPGLPKLWTAAPDAP